MIIQMMENNDNMIDIPIPQEMVIKRPDPTFVYQDLIYILDFPRQTFEESYSTSSDESEEAICYDRCKTIEKDTMIGSYSVRKDLITGSLYQEDIEKAYSCVKRFVEERVREYKLINKIPEKSEVIYNLSFDTKINHRNI